MKSLVDIIQPIQKLNIVRNIIPETAEFPNNALLPLLLYRQACQVEVEDGVRELLETNGWTDSWVDTIYPEHHFHSTAHEVLVALRGSARVQFGGPDGITLTFERGDVVIIPAGVAHRKVDETSDFACMGAYPDGQKYDMQYHKSDKNNLKSVPLPGNDPIYGSDGPLIKNWLSDKEQPGEGL